MAGGTTATRRTRIGRDRPVQVAGGVVPNPLPLSKLAVVDYATELLLEETESEWDPAGPSPAVILNRHRSQHIGQLALLLPRLQNWRQCNTEANGYRNPEADSNTETHCHSSGNAP